MATFDASVHINDFFRFHNPVIVKICSYLDFKSLKELSLVSSEWFDATASSISQRCLIRINERLNNIHNTNLRRAYAGVETSFLPSVPLGVEHLKLWDIKVTSHDLQKFNKLTHLTLVGCELPSGINHSNINFLKFQGPDILDSFLQETKLPKLQNFICGPHRATEGALREFIKHHPNVKIWDFYNVSYKIIQALENCTQIEKLSLNSDREINGSCFETITRFPSFKNLELRVRFTAADLLKINIQNLNSFSFYFWGGCEISLTKEEWKSWIPNCSEMRIFKLWSIRNVPLQLLSDNFPNLDELKLEEIDTIELFDRAVFQNIKKLELFCPTEKDILPKIYAPQLEFLEYDISWSSSTFQHIVSNFTLIKEIKLNESSFLKLSDLKSLIENLKKWRKIEIVFDEEQIKKEDICILLSNYAKNHGFEFKDVSDDHQCNPKTFNKIFLKYSYCSFIILRNF